MLGLINNESDGKLGKYDTIRRRDFYLVLYENLKKLGVRLDETDISKIVLEDEWLINREEKRIYKVMYKNGLFIDESSNRIEERRSVSREEALVIIYKAMQMK